MQVAKTSDAAPVERWARIRVARDVNLAEIRAQAPGDARRSEAINAMRAATDAASGPMRDALAAGLAARGFAGAKVDLAEQLWLDGSAIFHVVAPDGGPDALRAIDELVARTGGSSLDPADLPPGSAAPVTQRAASAVPAGATAGATASGSAPQWFSGVLGFDAAKESGLTGAGVRVAVVDSGVDATHPQLQDALARGTRIDHFPAVPITSGHGTFVAGIVAGTETGLAPGVDLISSRTYGASFTDWRGEDEPSRQSQRANAIRALQDALAPPGGERGADVLVTSWGILDQPGVPAHDYDVAMQTIAAAGAVVVAAAGNDGAGPNGQGSLSVPAQLQDVLAVGGVDRHGAWHPKASVGPSPRTGVTKPDLSAPVVDIRSTALGGGSADTTGGSDGGFAGTSAAAPIGASLVALLTQAVHEQGGASPDVDEVRSVLGQLTIDVDAPGPDPRTGVGVACASRVRDAAARIIAARAAH
jgi:subtilisin family serine protease